MQSPWVVRRGLLSRLRGRSRMERLTYWPTTIPERSRWKSGLLELTFWIVTLAAIGYWGFGA